MRRRLLFLICAGLLVGCQVRTTVTVDMDDDGSGTVEVAAALDAEALAELPDLDKNSVVDAADLTVMLRVDDLRATGWTVSEPETAADGMTTVTATKRFGTPDEAAAVLNELTGTDGPLHGFALSRSHAFGKTTYAFSGTADLSAGLEAFGDEGLAAALDGEPLGEDGAAIEQRYGKPLSELFTLEVVADLPGSSQSWEPVLGGAAVQMETDSTVYNSGVLGLVALAVGCVVGLVVLLGGRMVRSRRH